MHQTLVIAVPTTPELEVRTVLALRGDIGIKRMVAKGEAVVLVHVWHSHRSYTTREFGPDDFAGE